MYIVNWLKGHPIISLWVVGLVLFLLYWSGPANSTKTAIKNNQVALESKQTTTEENKSSEVMLDQVTLDQKDKQQPLDKGGDKRQERQQPKPVNNDAIKSVEKTALVDHPSSSNAKLVKAKKADELAAVQTSTKNNVAATQGPFKEALEVSVDKQLSKAATTDLSSSSNEEMLLIAREAYWNNGLDEAAEIYQKLIVLEPNVLDHKGELGNVFWRQGFPKKAAELYSEIAIPMIKEGKGESVANMLGFIGLFYPDRAAQINDHLQVKGK